MSRLRANEVLNRAANGPFLATEGINIPGGKNIFFNDLSETTILTGNSLSTTDITSSTLTITEQVNLGDNDKIYFGDSNDLEIFHDGSNSFIRDNGTGDLYLNTNGTGIKFIKSDGESLAKFLIDGSVELYYDNDKKFETTSTGVAVAGVTTSTGGWAGTTSSANVLGGLAMSFTCGMNGRIQNPSINSTMLFGGSEYNGDNSEGITMPHDGKIYTATIFAEKVTGSAAIQAQINGIRDSSYGFNISGSNQTNVSQIQTWYESPLSFSAGDRINFSFETANITYLEVLTICFFVKFD